MDVAAGEGGDQFGKLADFEPDDFIHKRGKCGVGLSIKRDSDKALTPNARACRAKIRGRERLPAMIPNVSN